jgi:hypothetical protein
VGSANGVRTSGAPIPLRRWRSARAHAAPTRRASASWARGAAPGSRWRADVVPWCCHGLEQAPRARMAAGMEGSWLVPPSRSRRRRSARRVAPARPPPSRAEPHAGWPHSSPALAIASPRFLGPRRDVAYSGVVASREDNPRLLSRQEWWVEYARWVVGERAGPLCSECGETLPPPSVIELVCERCAPFAVSG